MPFAAVFNNLVVFDPAKPHESLETVIPDLADSWAWDATNTKLTFKLHQGVKWHDGQPFTAKDVQCLADADRQGGDGRFSSQPPSGTRLGRQHSGDYEATFGWQAQRARRCWRAFSAVYPCRSARACGPTGLYRAVRQCARSDSCAIRIISSDEIAVRTIDNRATRMLAFATGDYDITFPSDVSVPLLRDIKARAPNAICELITTGTQINLLVNRVNPPFDNPDIRKAMSLALDREASTIS
jgi:peptide/nickel transport system substrate-binding protein